MAVELAVMTEVTMYVTYFEVPADAVGLGAVLTMMDVNMDVTYIDCSAEGADPADAPAAADAADDSAATMDE